MRRGLSEKTAGLLFLLPNIAGFFLFTAFPVLFSLILSFCVWDLLSWPPRFVGLGNFVRLVGFTRAGGSAADGWLLGAFVLLILAWLAGLVFVFRFWSRPDGRRLVLLRVAGPIGLIALFLAIVAVGRSTFPAVWKPNDPQFWRFFYNTLFLMCGIPIGMACSLGLAVAMNRKLRGITLFRTLFFLPNFCAGIAICVLWRWLYNADFGLVNSVIEGAGRLVGVSLRGPDWLGDPFWAKPALMIMGLWGSVGGTNMILYLAALQNINPELYEAAQIDGAGPWQCFRSITWPLISPTTFFITVMSVIGGLQGGFQAAFILTQGGPVGSTTTMSYYIYTNAYVFYRMGYAASVAWILFLCVFLITLFNWRYGGRRVHYD